MELNMMPADQPWRKLPSSDDRVITGPMGNCVTCVVMFDNDVRAYHGLGGLEVINFAEIKQSQMDRPRAKMFVICSSTHRIQDRVENVIDEQQFANLEWLFYHSDNATVFRNGLVFATGGGRALTCQRRLISKFAGLVKKRLLLKPAGGTWTWAVGVQSGEDVQTGPLGEHVAVVCSSGGSVGGSLGKGGIEDIKFDQIKAAGRDVPRSKFMVISSPPVRFESLHAAARSISDRQQFKNLQWEFYQSANASVDCNGVVKHTLDGKAVTCLGSFAFFGPMKPSTPKPRGPAVTPRKAR